MSVWVGLYQHVEVVMEAVTRRCSVIIVILKKLRKIHWKHMYQRPQAVTSLKTRLWHRRYPVNARNF